jgi:hypothetical protein
VALLAAAPVLAQTPVPAGQPPAPAGQAPAPAAAGDAQLRLIVVDQTSAGIPTATVTLTPPVGQPITVNTDERGVVTVPSLPVGVTKVHVEFVGFETYDGELNIRRGANNLNVTMKLAGFTEDVVVREAELVGGDTRGGALVTTLTPEEIDALPDDPEDLQEYLEQLAGPEGATFYMNGFRGGRLPTKDEIRTIRIRQNSFAADGHESGGRAGIEIITRPSAESFAGNINFGYQSDALNARNAQAQFETPEGNKQVQFQFRGPVIRNKTAFTLTVNGNNRFTSNNPIAIDAFGNRVSDIVRVPTDQRNVNLGIEHALTNNSTLRLSYQRSQSEGRNQGLGQFDYVERARISESNGNMFRAQIQGIVGKSSLNEIRFQFNRNTSATSSLTQGPTIIVQDAFNAGSAGVNSNSLSQTFELADNFDFTPHRNHQVRVGLLLEGGTYEFFDQTNPEGRTVYASIDDYRIDRRLQFTQRLGLVDTSFNQYQLGLYIQDEIKVNNRLSVGLGLRNEMQSHISSKMNLMPRLGFSLNPGGDRTSIRGGYGIYYDWFEASLYDTTLRLNGVAQREILINYEYELDEFGNPVLDGGGKAIPLTPVQTLTGGGPTNKTVAAPDLDMPYVHQASIGVQHQLLPSVNMQLTYQRQEGRNQLRGIDINTPVFNPETGLFARPDPAFGIITQITSNGRSTNNRLTFQTRFQLPQQRGMLQVGYQLQESMSDFQGATSLPSNSLNPELDWGPAGSDIRHQAQIGGMVRLPYDFRLQGNFQFRSAPAYNLTTGVDDNRDGVINDRPEGVGRNSLRGESTWNITQFTINKAFGFGGPRGGANANQNQGGNFQGGGNFQRGGGGFQGGGGNFRGGGNFGNASNQRFQVQFSVRAQNPLNRVIAQGWTGNMRSPFFMTATGVQNARRVEFETSFRF